MKLTSIGALSAGVLGFVLGSCAAEDDDPFAGLPGYACEDGQCRIGVCEQGLCVEPGDEAGDGDGDPSTTGDGDGDPTTTGDGDGDGDPTTTGDGDGDGDGDPTTTGDGDGDGDPTTTGDGDGDGDVPKVTGATMLWTSNVGDIPASLDFSPDDTLLASGGWDGFSGDFMIRTVANGSTVAGPTPTNLDNYGVSWSPSGDRVASIWAGNTDYAIFSSTGQNLGTADDCAGGNATALRWHPIAEEILVATDQLDYLCLRNAQTGATIESWPVEGYTHTAVVWSNSGARFASYASDYIDGAFTCNVYVFDRQTLAQINMITLDYSYCDSSAGLAWRPGTQLIYATGSYEEEGIVARMNSTGDVTGYFGADARALAFSPDGSKLALLNDTGYVWIVDADTWDVEHEFWAHSGLTLAVAWSHDGQRLATGGETPRLRMWQIEY